VAAAQPVGGSVQREGGSETSGVLEVDEVIGLMAFLLSRTAFLKTTYTLHTIHNNLLVGHVHGPLAAVPGFAKGLSICIEVNLKLLCKWIDQ